MITSYIGSVFLEAYNAREGTDYNGKRFFTEVFHPLFFDHEKYMLWPSNSPFVQGVKKGKPFTPAERAEKLAELHHKINTEPRADASMAIGYPAAELTRPTSGQVTGMELPLQVEDYYLSWIGATLGIGVEKGWVILFDNPEILLSVFDGWRYYRELLEGVPQTEPNKVLTWNGCWIQHRYDTDMSFDPKHPTDDFLPHEKVSRGEKTGFDTVGWAEVMQGVARYFPNERLMGYIWKPGKTNETIGFIPFELPEIVRPLDMYVKLFGMDSAGKARALFGTAMGFEWCCQRGSIGIFAMEPKGLRDIMTGRKALKYKPEDEQNKITFQTYLTWILAMLNNEEMWSKALEIAQSLYQFTQGGKAGRTLRSNLIETDVLGASTKKVLLKALNDVKKELSDKESIAEYDEFGKVIHMMQPDNVSYFMTLVRFQYTTVKFNSNL